MKSVLYSLLLVGTLANCSKNEDPAVATDPFLGHWESRTLRHLDYDATGKQMKDETTPVSMQLDVSATTLIFRTMLPSGAKAVDRVQYVRNWESITLSPPSANTGARYMLS